MDSWEYPGASGDETFGFFNVGLSLGIPRSAVPEEEGSREVAAGIQHVTRGDGLTAINGTDDDSKPIDIFGLSLGSCPVTVIRGLGPWRGP